MRSTATAHRFISIDNTNPAWTGQIMREWDCVELEVTVGLTFLLVMGQKNDFLTGEECRCRAWTLVP